MRVVLIFALALGTMSCASPPRIDWAKTAQSALEGTCRQSSRCDVPACRDPEAGSGCDNPYPGQSGRANAPFVTP